MELVLEGNKRAEYLHRIMSRLFPGIQEIVVYCPGCKTLEALSFDDGWLMNTRKFSQHDGLVFHDCGTEEPCRLYRP